MIKTVQMLLIEIINNNGNEAELEIWDTSGNQYDLVEVYQSDDGPHILCFDVQKKKGV